MKYATRLGLVLAVSMAAPGVSYADATTYLVGGGNGKATFVSDAPLETMTGKTKKVTGSVTVDPADITKTKGKFKVPVKSIRTGSDLRDEHLQGDGWLDAKKNPFLHFEITEVMLGKKSSTELKQGFIVFGRHGSHGIGQHHRGLPQLDPEWEFLHIGKGVLAVQEVLKVGDLQHLQFDVPDVQGTEINLELFAYAA